jgi:hypothetical protein
MIFFSQKQEEKIKVKNIFCATTENQTGNCKTLRQEKKQKRKPSSHGRPISRASAGVHCCTLLAGYRKYAAQFQ